MPRPKAVAVVAAVVAFFAITGTGVAVSHYVIISTKEIKPSVLRSLQGKTGPQGSQGPQGPAGAQGPQGPAGPVTLGALVEVKGTRSAVPAEKVASSVATCPAGDHVVAGGNSMFAGEVDGFDSEAERPSSWFVIVTNGSTFSGGWVEAIAYCAPAGQAVSARAPKGHPKEDAAIRALTEALERRH